MDTDLCREDMRGKHDYKILVPMDEDGHPNGKPVSKYCAKCYKSVDLTEDPNEVAFPDLNKDQSIEY